MKQVALVTGAAQGLGRVIAGRLHAAGYAVAVTDRMADAVGTVAAELDPTGETAVALALDVTRKADFEAALAAVRAKWGGLQVAVNNAAITPTTPVMQITPEEFDQVITVNLRGAFLGCQVFGAYFASCGYGRIVNLASLAGQNGGTASGAHYASSKSGILTLTKIFARELGASNVTVNAVAPGPMDLPSVHAAVPAERLARIVDTIPVKRLGDPVYVADIVVKLAAPEASFVTGAAWDINGGIFMR
ncbi:MULTISPECIES: SDR family NAD(P)-dependent oxidoreductase [unclassified Xanthobacter]|uniref:SDR family NAD(P)-dependent oxidoreductase n=1 Tax=unclassified Xanthobacter TaxID=2623496 RepID=UPI001EE12222|nr:MULTISPECIES: SDR family oxidoreductase [unclassified Xanthobacter]